MDDFKDFFDTPFIIDSHVHLISETNEDNYLFDEKKIRFYNLPRLLKKYFLKKSFCIKNIENCSKESLDGLLRHISYFPIEYYCGILAMDYTYNEDGEIVLEKTSFSIGNDYVINLCKKYKNFFPICSVHPYRRDVSQVLKSLYQKGVRMIKTIPNTMFFDCDNDLCEEFFKTLSELKMVLLTHVGNQDSTNFVGCDNSLGHPYKFSRWLEKYSDLKIIFAHVGSIGKGNNLDKKKKSYFQLTLEVMKKFPKQTYADISGLTAALLKLKNFYHLLPMKEIHERLIFGSDYPVSNFKEAIKLTFIRMKRINLIDKKEFEKISKDFYNIFPTRTHFCSYIIFRLLNRNGCYFSKDIFYKNIFKVFEDRDLPQPLKALKKRVY